MANAKQRSKSLHRLRAHWLPLVTISLLTVGLLGAADDDIRATESDSLPLEVAGRAQNAEELHLLNAAEAAEDVGQLGKAERLYRAILDRWPDSRQAREGLQRVLRGHQAGVVDQKQKQVKKGL